MSFTSTLYLCPVLDLLLISVPPEWQAEVRLGLQEALVNAAKHGNNLDPSKTIIVRFTVTNREYSWIIVDQGRGFVENNHNLDDCDRQSVEIKEKPVSLSIVDANSSIESELCSCNLSDNTHFNAELPKDESENGRGFSILHHVFDYVHWNRDGTQLTLSKEVPNSKTRQPSIC